MYTLNRIKNSDNITNEQLISFSCTKIEAGGINVISIFTMKVLYGLVFLYAL